MKALLSEYYGDNIRWFLADVIDATPPYGLEGRVRIRIHGAHSPSTKDIRQADLPWAQCVVPTTEGGVSGIGKIPKLQAGSFVFGFFMDGVASQVPLVLGSIPRIEYPSRVQQRIEFENVVERLNPTKDFYEELVDIISTRSNIDASNTGEISVDARESRIVEVVKFFLDRGYTIKQSVSIAAAIDFISSMISFGPEEEDKVEIGIALWSYGRLERLKNFSNNWKEFATQLAFILYELNTSQTAANIRILNSDRLEGDGNTCAEIFSKYYLKLTDTSSIESIKNSSIDLYGKLVG